MDLGMARKSKILAGIGGFLILFLIVVVIVLATFDWNRLKPYIDAKASDAIGRPFAINGDLRVQWQRERDEDGWRAWVPWPHVTANDISIGNAEWAKAPTFATLKQVQFSVSPLPLLAQRLVIRRIQLTQPSADLERLADGRANWVFTQKETGEPSPWVLDINEIGFDQGRVGYRDEMLQADLQVVVDPLGKPVPFADVAGAKLAGGQATTTDQQYVFGWGVKGKYKGLAVDGKGKVGGMLALQDSKDPFPLQADVALGHTKASVAGTLTNPMSLGALDLHLKLAGDSMADLHPLTGVTLPDTPPYSTDGRLIARLQDPAGARFEYKDFNGKVGNSDVHGDVTYAAIKPRPKLTGNLTSNQLRFADLGPLIGADTGKAGSKNSDAKTVAQAQQAADVKKAAEDKKTVADKAAADAQNAGSAAPLTAADKKAAAQQKAAAGKKAAADKKTAAQATKTASETPADQPADKALPVQEFRTERWRDMDADVTMNAKRIVQAEDLPLTDLQAHVVLNNGLLSLAPLRFGMAGGSLDSDIRLDGSKHPMDGRVKVSARKLKLKQLFPAVKSMDKSLGELNGDAALSGSGNSVAALLGSANGEAKLLVNDGVISRSLMELAGLNVGNYVVAKLFGDEEVAINCGAADVQLKNGLATPSLFVFDTQNALINIDGTADFKTEKLDLDITPHSKGLRIISLRSPLYVDGTMKNPKAGVKIAPLAARGAGAVVLGAVLTPVAALLALVVPSNDKDQNQCTDMLQQMRQPSKAPPPRPAAAARGN
jgi:uncharacterized protein involved in outer membrane biogenesis